MSADAELVRRARDGDAEAVQALRESGYFDRARAAQRSYPVSHGQRRLWVLHQLSEGSPAYNMPIALSLQGPLDTAQLRRCLQHIVDRHEILRTTFTETDGLLRQRVHERMDGWYTDLDLRDADAAGVAAVTLEHATRRFDLENGPLVDACLAHLGPERHLLLFNVHHSVCDGASLAILVHELTLLYGTASEGRPAPLAPLSRHYRHYAQAHNEALAEPAADLHRAYWQAQLSGAPPLDLATDYPRPAIMGFEGARVSTVVSGEVVARFWQLTARHSRLVALLALVQLLLYRHTGQHDLTIGCPVTGRDDLDLAGQIGFYVNTLALRGSVNPRQAFAALVAGSRATLEAALEHQIIPFDELVASLGVGRDTSRSPLIDVMVTVEDGETEALALGPCAVTTVAPVVEAAKCDLTFHFSWSEDDALQVDIVYDRALFGAPRMQALLGHMRALIQGIAAHPDRPVGQLDMLSTAERERSLESMDATSAGHLEPGTVIELFERRARAEPQRLAVSDPHERLTYSELDARASTLAQRLLGQGLAAQAPVAVACRRSVDMLVAILAVHKAGAAHLPLDPDYPNERLAFMLADAGSQALLANEEMVGLATRSTATVLRIEDAGTDTTGARASRPAAHPESLAYAIYTSGTTGRPKGVAATHRGLKNLVDWHRRTFEVSADDRATQLAGIGFDASVWEIFPYLTAGASVHMPPAQVLLEPEALQDWLVAEAITLAFVPTPVAEALMSLRWPTDTALRAMLTGGDRLRARPPPELPFQVFNNYGPTEYTVVTTCAAVSPAHEHRGLPAIGRPIANTRCFVLDEQMQPLPLGATGELCVAGEGLARGYLNRPGATAERFVPDPFSATPGARMYRTGDRVRYRFDMALEYIGRRDGQVKLRGFRIELGEVEAVLGEHPEVERAVVALTATAGSESELAAYLVAPEDVDTAGVRAHARSMLPEYMVPARWVPVPALPLTAHGKVDLQALAALEEVPAGVPERPLTEVETVLSEIYREVLDRTEVDPQASFFDQGGHSLSAARVLSRVRAVFRAELALTRFFRDSSVAALAAALTGDAASAAHAERVAQAWRKLQGLSEADRQALARQASQARDEA